MFNFKKYGFKLRKCKSYKDWWEFKTSSENGEEITISAHPYLEGSVCGYADKIGHWNVMLNTKYGFEVEEISEDQIEIVLGKMIDKLSNAISESVDRRKSTLDSLHLLKTKYERNKDHAKI